MSVRPVASGNHLNYLVQGVLSLFLLWMNQSCSGRLRLVLILTISPRPSKKVRTVVSSSSTESDILAQSTQSRALVGDLRRAKMNGGKFWGCLIVGHKGLIICTGPSQLVERFGAASGASWCSACQNHRILERGGGT